MFRNDSLTFQFMFIFLSILLQKFQAFVVSYHLNDYRLIKFKATNSKFLPFQGNHFLFFFHNRLINFITKHGLSLNTVSLITFDSSKSQQTNTSSRNPLPRIVQTVKTKIGQMTNPMKVSIRIPIIPMERFLKRTNQILTKRIKTCGIGNEAFICKSKFYSYSTQIRLKHQFSMYVIIELYRF